MTESGRELARRLRRRWALIELAANAGGALVLLAFLHAFHSAADPHHATEEDVAIGTVQVLVYLARRPSARMDVAGAAQERAVALALRGSPGRGRRARPRPA